MKRSILVSLALASTMVFASCATPSPTSVSEAPAAPDAAAPATEQAAPAYAVFAKDGVAIAGADPVAYFTQSDYVPGSDEFTHDWEGATWQFASAENRDLFAANPEEYAPQYGGFCAWAVSQGSTAAIDPTAWKIVDGKLYLNYSAGIQKKWSKDIPGNIAKADQNWPAVLAN
ncbi:YHS domain-containing (seleno)protein [Leptothoe sp. PORK10 BA2]|uniref:YHS domain-containing (seleno)protein n=1 Tax=Leptothoe sp. PORK10 BA2 TaxID=3110254 RepID=UPI002B1F5C3B|nr:YHS domain-containing (seleno)protein [Leptothoe sp. PORK10 BA2]MEA5465786.1 YHS domain-containing (seleno)protein [Leptothoe sp. PORK10 BA2]